MFSQLLDASVSLLGRRFLFGAFLPMAIFLFVVFALDRGWEGTKTFATTFAQQELKDASFEALGAAALTFLLAYLMHGLRQLVRAFFEGSWPWLMHWLAVPFRFKERTVLHWRDIALSEALEAKDDALWWWFCFGEKYTGRAAPACPTQRTIRKLQRSIDQVVAALNQGRQPVTQLHRLLGQLRTLYLYRARYPSDIRVSIESLVEYLKKNLPNLQSAETDAADKGAQMRSAKTAYKSLLARSRTAGLDAYLLRHAVFPRDERWLRPTRFGNISMVNQEYPLLRYGIALGELWPRLSEVISPGASERIDEAQTYVDFTLALTLLSGISAVLAMFMMFPPDLDREFWQWKEWLVWALAVALSLFASHIFYRLAVGANLVLNLQMQSAIDLFRLKLLEHMEIARPRTPNDEEEIWRELSAHIVQGTRPKRWRWFTPR